MGIGPAETVVCHSGLLRMEHRGRKATEHRKKAHEIQWYIGPSFGMLVDGLKNRAACQLFLFEIILRGSTTTSNLFSSM